MNAESRRTVDDARDLYRTSMRPRPDERGKIVTFAIVTLLVWTSMRPRPDERGKAPFAHIFCPSRSDFNEAAS